MTRFQPPKRFPSQMPCTGLSPKHLVAGLKGAPIVPDGDARPVDGHPLTRLGGGTGAHPDVKVLQS